MDDMDRYIDRCLKNWGARYSPPADGREKLLQRAAQPAGNNARRWLQRIGAIRIRVQTAPDAIYAHSHMSFLAPSTLPALWSIHLMTNQRLAT